MKRPILSVVVGASLVAIGAGSEAKKVDLDLEASAKVASSYVWRGKVVSDDPVVQPEFTARVAPWTFDLWGTWDLESEKGSSDRTRVDSSLDYSTAWQGLRVKGGMVAHVYHDSPNLPQRDTYEAYVDVMADVSPVVPALIVYYDFGQIHGVYGALSLSYTKELDPRADLVVRLSVGAGSKGFNEDFFAVPAGAGGEGEAIDVRKAAMVDATASISVPMTIWKQLTVTPRIEYTTLIDGDLRDASKATGSDPDDLIGSVTVQWEF